MFSPQALFLLFDIALALAHSLCFHPDGERCGLLSLVLHSALAALVATTCGVHDACSTCAVTAQHQRSAVCRLLAGLKEGIVVWRLGCPGRDYDTIATKATASPQKGILASLAVAPQGDLVAAGSFNATVGVYDLRDGAMHMLLRGHSGGVTFLQFSGCDPSFF